MPAFTVAVNIAGRILGNFRRAFKEAKQEARKTSKSVKGSMDSLNNALAVTAVTTGLVKVVDTGVKIEDSMLRLKKVAGGVSEKEMPQFNEQLEQLAVSGRVRSTVEDLYGTATYIAQALGGIGPQQLMKWTEFSARTAVAFDATATEVADSMTKTVEAFAADKSLEEKAALAQVLADSYTVLGNNVNTTEKDLLGFNLRAAGVAKAMNLSGAESAAYGAALMALGTPSSVAANSLNAILPVLLNLDGQSSRVKDAMKELGVEARNMTETEKAAQKSAMSALGFSGQSLAEGMAKDGIGTLMSVLEALEAVDDQTRGALVSDIFGQNYGDEILKMVGGLDKFRETLGYVQGDVKGAAETEADIFLSGMGTQLQTARNEITLLVNELAQALFPSLNKALKIFNSVAKSVRGMTEQYPFLGEAIAVVAAGFVALKVAQIALGPVQAATTALAWAFSLALKANPIGLVITGVAALAAGAYLLYKNWDSVSEWFGGVWDWILEKVKVGVNALNWLPGVDIRFPELVSTGGNIPTAPAIAEPETPAVVQQYLDRADARPQSRKRCAEQRHALEDAQAAALHTHCRPVSRHPTGDRRRRSGSAQVLTPDTPADGNPSLRCLRRSKRLPMSRPRSPPCAVI